MGGVVGIASPVELSALLPPRDVVEHQRGKQPEHGPGGSKIKCGACHHCLNPSHKKACLNPTYINRKEEEEKAEFEEQRLQSMRREWVEVRPGWRGVPGANAAGGVGPRVTSHLGTPPSASFSASSTTFPWRSVWVRAWTCSTCAWRCRPCGGSWWRGWRRRRRCTRRWRTCARTKSSARPPLRQRHR